MNIIAREVEFAPDAPREIYHAVDQNDYLAIVALTPDGYIPLVQQYRPAVERFTLELPAGLLEPGEEPAAACARELLEETGHPAKSVHLLHSRSACTGRLCNRIHSCFIETGDQRADFDGEPGVTVRLVTPGNLVQLIESGEFDQQMHLGALLLAELKGFLILPH